MKTLLIILLFLNVVACDNTHEETKQKALMIPVVTQNIQAQSTIRLHKIPTILLAKTRANLSMQLSGKVVESMIKIGQQVEKDQLLMRVYNPSLTPALTSGLANLESLNVQIKQLRKDLENIKNLRVRKLSSRNAQEQKQTELDNLIAKSKLTQAQIALAKANQKEALLTAPFSGTIVSIHKQIGEMVQASQIVVVMNQTDVMEVEVSLTKNLWENLILGQIVHGFYGQERMTFVVAEISASSNSLSHLMKVVLQAQTALVGVVGQEVIIEIPQTYENVYQLPLSAVVDDGINKPYLFLDVDSVAQKIYINPLYIDDGSIIFETNKKIVQPVVIKGQSKLSQAMKLEITNGSD